MDAQTLIAAPRLIRTARTVLKSPDIAQVAVRQAWAAANFEALLYVDWWRRSVDQAVAVRSVHSEIASLETGTELMFNVFTADESTDVRASYACGEFVGRIDLHSWDFAVPRCEIGYMGDVRTQGKGLLREAANAALALAFALGAHRVEAITDTRNHRSIRCAQALGLSIEGVLRHYERDFNGDLCDQVLLAVVTP